jgi:hypothetical protein
MMTAELAKQIRELIDANARPISLSEITARAHSPEAPCRPGLVRPKLRLGLAAAVVAGAVAAGCVGAISFGRLSVPGHLAGRPARPAGAILTAAQVRRMTGASRAALAYSARAYLSYGGPSPYDPFGVADIAFSGADYSVAGSVVNPAASDRPGQVAWFADRVVNGQAYAHERDSEGWHWFHYARPAGSRPARIVDPRVMLGVLAPGERFRITGHVVAWGVPLVRLEATDLAKVPGLSPLTGVAGGEYATSLDVLVDSRGIVHQVNISLRGTTLTAAGRFGKQTAPNALLAGQGPVPLAAAGSTNVTVTFVDIGRPQTITVPSHAIDVRTPWGANGHPLPPSVMLSAGVAGS